MRIIILIILFNCMFADQRNFVWTYENIMLEPGETELELYFTNYLPNFDISKNPDINTLKLEAEIEIGMTENLEVSFYNVFKESPEYNEDGTILRKLQYDEYKLRFKYRVFKNGHKWAPLFYSELKGKPDFTKWVAEQKLIFNRKFNNINFSFNPILELEFELQDNGKWEKEIETEFAAGFSYNRGENFSYGIDLKSSEYSTYIGPVLAHGNEDKWWTIGIMKKVAGEDEKAELVLRSIMGFHF